MGSGFAICVTFGKWQAVSGILFRKLNGRFPRNQVTARLNGDSCHEAAGITALNSFVPDMSDYHLDFC